MGQIRPRIAIIGAGPIGLEAALHATLTDRYDVVVYERDNIAAHIRQWGHVNLFSPFCLNSSPWGRETISQHYGTHALPTDDAQQLGSEFIATYLEKIAALPAIKNIFRLNTNVISISKEQHFKADAIGKAERGQDLFRILIEQGGTQSVEQAEIVIDCSGTYANSNWLGAGGMPCVGERDLMDEIHFGIPDLSSHDTQKMINRRVLVVGSGYSAATTIVNLATSKDRNSTCDIFWVTRRNSQAPIPRIPDDPLQQRDALAQQANALATEANNCVHWLAGTSLEQIRKQSTSAENTFLVDLITSEQRKQHPKTLEVDEIFANVGYRPDRSMYEELQIHECYATQGPLKLAAALLGETSEDCLTQTTHGVETLQNPEPNFFILGAKSYGRNSQFLLRVGIQQIQDLFHWLNQQLVAP